MYDIWYELMHEIDMYPEIVEYNDVLMIFDDMWEWWYVLYMCMICYWW